MLRSNELDGIESLDVGIATRSNRISIAVPAGARAWARAHLPQFRNTLGTGRLRAAQQRTAGEGEHDLAILHGVEERADVVSWSETEAVQH
jgi:hypothetical protein